MVVAILLLCWSLGIGMMNHMDSHCHPEVTTIHGKVRGSILESREGRPFAAFRGIPYAKPPVGDLRFKPPQRPEYWKHTLNATKDANMCIQQDYLFQANPKVEGSEDCLYLNVYTPYDAYMLTKLKRRTLLPVMVFIHYGGLFVGSSSSDVLGPEYFMDKNVLLVTFNYRLGIFGFFSTYDDAAPGNWGFKDQVAALKWVQMNIKRFGGDPKQVTLFGQSAGSASTHHHILSPRSKGLFRGAISQSGSALALWAKPQRELSLIIAQIQADIVGCNSTSNTTEMVDCLREIPAAKLVESMNSFRIFRSEPLNVYTPTIEFQTQNNPEPFITKDPIEIIENGEFANVPWIIGTVRDEGILRASPLTRQTDLLEIINENFETYLPQMMSLELSVDDDQISSTWDKIKEFFFLNKDEIDVSNPDSVQGLINIYSDRAFLYPAYQMALLHRHKGHEKIWFYNFNYKGNRTFGDLFALTDNDIDFKWGVSHCDDLLYLFNSPKYFPNYKLNNNDLLMSKLMIGLFTDFATHLDPTPKECWGLDNRWETLPSTEDKEIIENSDLHYLVLSGKYSNNATVKYELKMATEYFPERMSFWIRLPLKENIEDLA